MDSKTHADNIEKPLHLYFDRNLEKLNLTPELLEVVDQLNFRTVLCRSWHELGEQLRYQPRSISFFQNELNYTSAADIVNMVRTMSALVNLPYKIHITVTIQDNFSVPQIRQLKKSGINGIIPVFYCFGLKEATHACDMQAAGQDYWPKHIIDRLPNGAKKNYSIDTDDIALSPRQQQIYDIIKKHGSSNEEISRTLNISESTVRINLNQIYKKFGVRNRTQLVVFNK